MALGVVFNREGITDNLARTRPATVSAQHRGGSWIQNWPMSGNPICPFCGDSIADEGSESVRNQEGLGRGTLETCPTVEHDFIVLVLAAGD
jgi:hypothetical protein